MACDQKIKVFGSLAYLIDLVTLQDLCLGRQSVERGYAHGALERFFGLLAKGATGDVLRWTGYGDGQLGLSFSSHIDGEFRYSNRAQSRRYGQKNVFVRVGPSSDQDRFGRHFYGIVDRISSETELLKPTQAFGAY